MLFSLISIEVVLNLTMKNQPLGKEKLVFTNGCFDVVHRCHFELLQFCKSLGRVIVGINSDDSVRKLKGINRPINTAEDRLFVLLSCKYVDEVIIFSEDTPYELIKIIQPDIIVKGGDYQAKDVIGSEFAEVKIFENKNNYSTSWILSKIL